MSQNLRLKLFQKWLQLEYLKKDLHRMIEDGKEPAVKSHIPESISFIT